MTSVPDGMFLDQYGNAKRKAGDLSGAELRYFEQYRRQQVARNNRQDAQARGAPTIPTIPNLPSLELPQMVPPVQEGIASLAPQPMVPAFQPFIPAPAPTNTGYNFQELLNMYKNPYA